MKTFRTFATVLFVLVSFTLSVAASANPSVNASTSIIVSSAPSLPTRLTDGPAPIPLCPPDARVCDMVNPPEVAKTDGPAPIPLCPPDARVCDMVNPPEVAKTDGPAPIPLCPPDARVCDMVNPPEVAISFSV